MLFLNLKFVLNNILIVSFLSSKYKICAEPISPVPNRRRWFLNRHPQNYLGACFASLFRQEPNKPGLILFPR